MAEASDDTGLTPEQKAAALAATAEADATVAELQRLRGAYLSEAAGIEGILNLFLAGYFLRSRDDPHAHGEVLQHWYSWLLGRLSFSAKLDVVTQICREGVGMERVRESGFPDVLSDVRRANTRRNQLAHASVGWWPRVATDGSFEIGVTTHHIGRGTWEGSQPVDLEALAAEVAFAKDVALRLQTACRPDLPLEQ